MKIDYVIMGHESRRDYIDDLFWQLIDCPINFLAYEIDNGSLGVWENAKRAWLHPAVKPGADYRVVIQDDAILCDKFGVKAEQFLSDHDGQICSFYFGDEETRTKYIRPDYFDAPLYHAVALAIPTKMIPAMVAYCDGRKEIDGDDMKMKRWLISLNRTCRYSNPSLVQHRDIESIIDPTKPLRQSAIFCD